MFDVITFGSAVRDLFVKSKEFKTLESKKFVTNQGLCLDLGSKIKVDQIFFSSGGGGTNSAATFSKQGFKAAYVGKIGNDPGGQSIKQELEELGIKTFLSLDKDKHTPYSIILSVSARGRTILVYRGASHELEKKDIPFNPPTGEAGKLKTKWFYISGLSGKSAKTLVPIVNFAKKNKIKIALNPGAAQLKLGLKKLKAVLLNVDVLILNQEEAARLADLPFAKEKKIFKKLDKHVQGIVVMTKGPKGVNVSDGKYIYQAGIFKEKKHIDRTGAGDAFGSGFVAGLIRSNKVEEAIRSGTANSASIVEHFGAKNGILSKSQILKDKRWRGLKITKFKP